MRHVILAQATAGSSPDRNSTSGLDSFVGGLGNWRHGTPLRVRSLTSSMITAMTVFRLAGGFEPRVYVYASHEIVEEYRAHMA